MEEKWTRKRILIWGKTRPEVSKTYREVVCTGGVFEDTGKLVRLYPIPLRFMANDQVFAKYQWIEAQVSKSSKDPRPESYKIRPDTIESFETVPTKNGDWSKRAEIVLRDGNVFTSLEELLDHQVIDGTSLGVIKPKGIESIKFEKYSEAENANHWTNYKAVLSQRELPQDDGDEAVPVPLSPPDFRYKVAFNCQDSKCKGHDVCIMDWELDALYGKLRKGGCEKLEAAGKVVDSVKRLCSNDHDLMFYIGNMASHPRSFSVVGLWYPKRTEQLSLF